MAVPDNCVVITVCRDEWPQLHSVMRGFRAGAALAPAVTQVSPQTYHSAARN